MPNLNQLTVTLPTGPGRAVTAKVLTEVKSVHFDFEKMVMTVESKTEPINPYSEFDYDSAATVTFSITGQDSTIVVSS